MLSGNTKTKHVSRLNTKWLESHFANEQLILTGIAFISQLV